MRFRGAALDGAAGPRSGIMSHTDVAEMKHTVAELAFSLARAFVLIAGVWSGQLLRPSQTVQHPKLFINLAWVRP